MIITQGYGEQQATSEGNIYNIDVEDNTINVEVEIESIDVDIDIEE